MLETLPESGGDRRLMGVGPSHGLEDLPGLGLRGGSDIWPESGPVCVPPSTSFAVVCRGEPAFDGLLLAAGETIETVAPVFTSSVLPCIVFFSLTLAKKWKTE